MTLTLVNARIYTPDEIIEPGTVVVREGKIHHAGHGRDVPIPPHAEVIDTAGQYLVPGFIDLQLNGAFGHDFTREPPAIWAVAAQLPRYGVTAFLPTIITSPLKTVQAAQQVMLQGPPAGFSGAWPCGLHLEGPYLNPGKKGAHNAAYMRRPSIPKTADWSPSTGIRLVTLAPELPGGVALIKALAGRGIVVSAGHSLATFAEAQAGFQAGITYGTHLFNAMPALDHREPGLAGAILADDHITFGLIADGIHVLPDLVRVVWQLAGRRLNLVTDAMAALGMPPGTYQLGDRTTIVENESVRLPDGTLAGSLLSLDEALRNLIQFTGRPLEEVLSSITSLPAGLMSLNKGRIAPGYDADLVLLSPDLQVQATFVAGRLVYKDTKNNESP